MTLYVLRQGQKEIKAVMYTYKYGYAVMKLLEPIGGFREGNWVLIDFTNNDMILLKGAQLFEEGL